MKTRPTKIRTDLFLTKKNHKPSPYPSIKVAKALNISDLLASSFLMNVWTG